MRLVKQYLRTWFRWATKNPRRRLASFLLVTMFLDQFVYPIIPLLHPKTISANGSIETISVGPELFINKNPDFNVRFGDRTNPTKHKMVFESQGKELELRLLQTQTLAIPASPSAVPQNELTAEITALQQQVGQVLGEVAQLSDELRQDLQKPILASANRGAKESIILSEKGAISNEMSFLLRLSPGIQIHQSLENLNNQNITATDSGQLKNLPTSPSYYFTDSKGKYLYHFEAPFMEDAANTKSTDVFYKIEQIDDASSFIQANSLTDFFPGNNYYKLTLVADSNWLDAPARVYPVTIDPTIVHDVAPNFSSGTENRSQLTSSSAVETQFKELQPDINTAGLWHFNESSSTIAYDTSDNTNNGTLTNGPVWNGPSDSKIGTSSLYFDGVNDYVTRADDSDFDFLGTDNFTVEAWFKTNGTVSAINIIAAKVSAVAGVGYKLYLDASGDACFGTDGTAGSFPADSACTSAIDYDDSAWHHIAGVRRGTTDIRIYVDGAEVGTADTAIADTATLANAGALYVGIDGDGSTTPFKGSIDEVRISRIARTSEEITAAANRFPYSVHESPVIDFGSTPNSLDSLTYSGSGIATGDGERPYSTDGLVAAWNFNETSGTTAYNTAGTDNLTLNNFASTSSQDQAAGTGWTANNKRFGAGAIMISSAATADTLSLTNPSALDPNSADLSIETWVKTTDITAELFSNNSANGVSCTSDGYYLGIDSSGYPVFTLDTDGATAGCDATITTSITKKVNDGVWHHLAANVTRGSAAYLYLDGVVVGSDTSITAYASEAPTGNVLIASTNNFDGVLDSIRFYSRALSQSEISSNSQSNLIEFQTRTGATATPNDGSWEAWRTTSGTGDTQIDSLDNPIDIATPSASIWQGVPVATASSTFRIEGTQASKITIGAPQVDGSTVALWHLDETSSGATDIKDATGTNNSTAVTGTTSVDGFYGKARSFNGSSFINLGKPSSLNITGSMTAEMWVRFNANTNYFFADFNSGGTISQYSFRYGSSSYLGFYQYHTDGTSLNFDITTATLATGRWYHVAFVRDDSAKTVQLYVDGAAWGAAQSYAGKTVISDTTAGNKAIGRSGDYVGNYLNGTIDEIRVSTATRTADEIAEGYRAGRDHRIGKSFGSAQDLSLKTKLPFYVASDRPGTFLQATIGESAYANYEPDSNTAGFWHLDEQNGTTNAYIKDSSGNNNNSNAIGGTTFIQGVLGKARSFNNSASDYITIPDSASLSITSTLTVDGWFYFNGFEDYDPLIVKGDQGPTIADTSYNLIVSSAGTLYWAVNDDTNNAMIRRFSGINLTTGKWYHVAGTYDGGTSNTGLHIYINGTLADGTVDSSGTFAALRDTAGTISLGKMPRSGITDYMNGSVDEARISNSVRSADLIRQAYEVGKRTHPITIDFKSTLDSSNLITGSGDTSFALPASAPNINKGEKIIVKENVAGTEYIAQGTVSAITYASGSSNPNAATQDQSTQSNTTTITVTSWDSGSTFPGSGFTANTTVFKWQREIFDLTQIPLTTQRDGITRITLRVTDAAQGATVYWDDIESADYSDGPRAIIGSTVARYFQYRAILNGSPTLNSVTINYNSGTNPLPPKTKDSSTDFSATGSSNNRVTDTGSSNSPQLELAYKELTTDINTQALYHFSSGACATDSSGNAYTLTANGGMTCATGGKFGFGASGFATTPVSYSQATVLDVALGSGTIEAWINPANLSAVQTILYADSTSDTLLTLGTSGQINFSTSGSTNLATGNSLVAASSWYHIAAVWTTTGHKIYVNGVEQASDTNTTTHSSQDYTTYIGVGSGGNTLPFSSFIDDIRITKVARTPEEIKLDAQRRPYGVYTSDVINLGSNISSIDNLRWAENGVGTGDGETPYSTNALVAQWNFNETSGTTAASAGSCGASCNGTLTSFASTASQDQAAGTGWTAANRRFGAGALMFDGTDDLVDVGSNAALDFGTGNFTYEAWIKRSKTGSSDAIIAQDPNTNPNKALMVVNTNVARIKCKDSGGVGATLDGNKIVTDGQWHHIVGVRNGTTVNLYVDGMLDATSTSGTANSCDAATTTRIGARNAAGLNAFTGIIDAARIYSRALSASEILSNYQAGNVELQTRTGTTTAPNDGTWEEWRPAGNSTEIQLDNLQTLSPVQKISTTNLVGYWKLDEVSGNRADSAGSNTLTDNATVTSKTGHLNLAGQFTAANSEYLSITDNAALSIGSGVNLTISCWMYLDSVSNQRTCAGKRTGAGAAEYDLMYVNATNRFRFRVLNSGGTDTTVNADAFGGPTTGTWYFVTAWYDATAATANIQINNGAINTTSSAVTPFDGSGDFNLGRTADNTNYMDGRLDEVAMWKRVLTADERKRLYEDGLDKTNDSVVGGINRSIDTTTKFEGSGSEKLTIGAPQVDSSTVALWHMDETSGSGAYIKDSTVNANNGTPTGTTSVDGFYGKARSFNGTSDYVDIGSESSLSLGSEFAIEAWIKLDVTSKTHAIYSKGTNEFFVENAASPRFGYYNGASVFSTSTLTAGRWYHVAISHTGTSVTFYLNGASDGTQTLANGEWTSTNGFIGQWTTGVERLDGTIDEFRISNIARSAEEIAEAYRAGRDHRLTRSFGSAQDLSAKTKLPFYIAADRPGTYLQATIGESAFANYEPDSNTIGLWHLEEDLGSADTTAFLKDSSGNGANMDPGTGAAYPSFVQGKIGKARYFDGGDSASATVSNPAYVNTLDLWIKPTSSVASKTIVTNLTTNASSQPVYGGCTGVALTLDVWTHIAATSTSSSVCSLYQNGVLTATGATGVTFGTTLNAGATSFIGTLDEIRLSNNVRTADEIRQAYEVGKRTHSITIDFVTSPQAAYSSGTSVTINNPSGTTNLTDTLSIGDTIIFKENVAGTETVSQAVVTGITNNTGYGTVTLQSAPTFPSGGFTTAATVFKFQREYFDVSGILSSSKDGITRITLRVTDGNEGRNVWIDDLKSAGPYLTNPTSRTLSVTSTPQKYVQYRIIFSTTDTAVSGNVTSVTLQAHAGPMKVTGADTFTASGSFDRDGNVLLGSNNVKDVQFYDRTKDQLSYALNFDGSNDLVSVTSSSSANGLTTMTVEGWIYTNGAGGGNFGRIIRKGNTASPSGSNMYWDVHIGSSAANYLTFRAGYLTNFGQWDTPTITLLNTWTHFAVVYTHGDPNNNPTMYINGSAVTATRSSNPSGSPISDNTTMAIGDWGTGTRSFNGIIDELAVFNTTRTATQIAADYNARRLSNTITGLVGLWHFDEGAGTAAFDSSGNANNGTLTGMVPADNWVNSFSDKDQSALSQQVLGIDPNWPSGPVRTSSTLNFNGSSSYINLGSPSSLDLAGPFTYEAWIKTSTATAAVIITYGTASQWYSHFGTDTTGVLYWAGYNGSSVTSIYGTTVVTDGNWHHVAIVYNGGTSETLYVDGKLDKSETPGISSISTPVGSRTIIGAKFDLASQFFNGLIDETAIFNSARTAAQISSDYNARRLKGNETNLQGLWHFDEGTDNTCSGGTNDICDASSNSNDGPSTGSPTWVTDARTIMDNNAQYIKLSASSSTATDKGLEIYAVSTTQFKYRWTGDQVWSSAQDFSSYSYSSPSQLGTTGVYVGFDTTNGTFGDESYFLIPSWAIQQFGPYRGTRRSFPERSYLVATDKGVDIIDADDNTLWMRIENGTGRSLGAFTNNNPASVFMTQGQLFVGTYNPSSAEATGLYRFDFNRDKIFRYNDTNKTTNTVNIAKRNTADSSYGSADTSQF
ncbi:MAG: hypothetical protein UX80_C0014G0002, partial [Candidatus Amesbacteria bacterium GW2011_GWA2_47_11b]